MTEDEAKTKWCPFVRLRGGFPVEAGFNREHGEAYAGVAPCIASTCMAWRWSEAKRSAAFLEAVQARMQAQAKPNFNTATQEVYAESGGQFERVEGHCGLAGGER